MVYNLYNANGNRIKKRPDSGEKIIVISDYNRNYGNQTGILVYSENKDFISIATGDIKHKDYSKAAKLMSTILNTRALQSDLDTFNHDRYAPIDMFYYTTSGDRITEQDAYSHDNFVRVFYDTWRGSPVPYTLGYVIEFNDMKHKTKPLEFTSLILNTTILKPLIKHLNTLRKLIA